MGLGSLFENALNQLGDDFNDVIPPLNIYWKVVRLLNHSFSSIWSSTIVLYGEICLFPAPVTVETLLLTYGVVQTHHTIPQGCAMMDIDQNWSDPVNFFKENYHFRPFYLQ